MFISLDESISNTYTVVGCLCVPLDLVSTQEENLVKTRIENKCWGEIDWDGISKGYIDKYKRILEKYLSHEKITFHSWAFKEPDAKFKENREKLLYQHEYLLLKHTLMKCLNAGYRKFYILLDDGRSRQEHELTRRFLDTTNLRPKPEIVFFAHVDSKIIGAMQIASICVSAVRSLYEDEANDENKKYNNAIIELLTKLNSNTPLNFSPKKPAWDLSKKFTHCLFDSLLKKPEFGTLPDIPF